MSDDPTSDYLDQFTVEYVPEAELEAAKTTMREVAEELRHEACGALTEFQRARIGALADRLDPPPVDATRSIHGGVHCAPPGGPHNTCYRQPDGSCESCGYPPPVVENPPA